MGLTLDVLVDGRRSEALSTRWRTLSVTDGVGYESDRAVLVVTVARPKVIEVPRLGSEISFVVKRDGGAREELGGALRTSSISGDSRDGSITVEAGAVKPGGVLREQRTTSWTGKALGEIVGAIAERSGLVPAVSAALAGIVPMGPIQEGESDRQFLGRLLDRENARINIKDGRLIALAEGETRAAVSGATLPATVVDLRGEAWVRWRRADSAVKGTVVARYIAEDGATVAMVKAGRGFPERELQTIFGSPGEALRAAERRLLSAVASRDWIEIETGLTPGARAHYPLEVKGQPMGFPSRFALHEVNHLVGGQVARTRMRARP